MQTKKLFGGKLSLFSILEINNCNNEIWIGFLNKFKIQNKKTRHNQMEKHIILQSSQNIIYFGSIENKIPLLQGKLRQQCFCLYRFTSVRY